MAIAFRAASAALLLSGALLAGCAGDGGDGGLFTTGALGDSSATAEAKVDPACVALTSRIEGLRKEGIAEKIEKASAKKYKMTQADLTKADQLTKANAEFQARCSLVSPKPATAQINSSTPKAGSGGPGKSVYSSTGGTSY
jgi:hypothetical protein